MDKNKAIENMIEASSELLEAVLNEQLSDSGKMAIADLIERGQVRFDIRMEPAFGEVSGFAVFPDKELLLFRHGPSAS